MKQLSIMLKPASSLCNMRCKYCFYADVSSLRSIPSFGLMQPSAAHALISNIFADLEAGDHLTLAFQGGEPTLAGLDFFCNFVEEVNQYQNKSILVQYALQTNGLLLDDTWCRFLKKNQFLVGLSLDGPAPYHNANRVDADRKGTFQQVMAAKQRLDRHNVEYNVLMTLTSQLARHPQQVWSFMEEQDLRYVQFTPCMGSLDGPNGPYVLLPARYAGFYIGLFQYWYSAYRSGSYRSVKLFDDLVNLLAFGQCNACGLLGQCQAQLVVEADGGVYPCDFYVLDEYQTGNLCRQTLRAVYESPVAAQFLKRPLEELPLCAPCPYRSICNGGCPRMRHVTCYAPGANICGHRMFLDACIGQLQEVAALARQASRRP